MTNNYHMTGINKRKAGPIIPSSIDIQCEVQTVPFAKLSKMKPGESSATIRERVIAARNIQEKRFSALPSREEAEALGLHLPGPDDALANDSRRLAGLHLRELGERHGLYLAVDVDTAGDYRARFSFVNCCHVYRFFYRIVQLHGEDSDCKTV